MTDAGTTQTDPAHTDPTHVIRHPRIEDGAAMWRVARDSQRLDLKPPYAYLLWARDFAATSLVVEVDGEVGGFVSGFLRPEDPSTVMVWQIAVDEAHRGHGLAGKLLDELAERTGAETLETTITESNPASIRLFDAFAARRGAEHEVTDLFTEEHFPPGDGWEPELLHRIAPLRPKAAAH